MAPAWLSKGKAVEVAGLSSEGFPASFYSAYVETVKGDRCVVSFPEGYSDWVFRVDFCLQFITRGGKTEVGEYSVYSQRLRPQQAQKPSPLSYYKVGQAADALYRSVWWQGVVHAVTIRRDGLRSVSVYLAEVDESTLILTRPETLRPGLVFKKGAWHPRKPCPLPAELHSPLLESPKAKAPAEPLTGTFTQERRCNPAHVLAEIQPSSGILVSSPPVPTAQLASAQLAGPSSQQHTKPAPGSRSSDSRSVSPSGNQEDQQLSMADEELPFHAESAGTDAQQPNQLAPSNMLSEVCSDTLEIDLASASPSTGNASPSSNKAHFAILPRVSGNASPSTSNAHLPILPRVSSNASPSTGNAHLSTPNRASSNATLSTGNAHFPTLPRKSSNIAPSNGNAHLPTLPRASSKASPSTGNAHFPTLPGLPGKASASPSKASVTLERQQSLPGAAAFRPSHWHVAQQLTEASTHYQPAGQGNTTAAPSCQSDIHRHPADRALTASIRGHAQADVPASALPHSASQFHPAATTSSLPVDQQAPATHSQSVQMAEASSLRSQPAHQPAAGSPSKSPRWLRETIAAAGPDAAAVAAVGATSDKLQNRKRGPDTEDEKSVDDGTVEIRRSSRAGKQRVIMINGQPVLRLNNYDKEDPSHSISVFDMELKGKKGRTTGQMGTSMVKYKVPAPKPKPDQGTQWVPKPARANEAPRQRHNDQVRADAAEAKGRRYAFLAQHIDVLTPFITPAVQATIRAAAARHSKLAPAPRPAPVEKQPEGIQGVMREYQVEGLAFMVSRFDEGIYPILADEMGLGKTLQTCALLSYMKKERGMTGPSLVVCPLSVLPSWMNELARWAPHLRAVRLHTSSAAQKSALRKQILSDPSQFDVAVTTYEMLKANDLQHAMSHTIHWRFFILDEGHRIKNEQTQTARAMRNVRSVYGSLSEQAAANKVAKKLRAETCKSAQAQACTSAAAAKTFDVRPDAEQTGIGASMHCIAHLLDVSTMLLLAIHQALVLLTGTPLQNNLHELYALLSFLYPDIFTTSAPFDAFNLTLQKVDPRQLEAAFRLLRPFCLRRLKADVEKSLPPRVETRIDCPLSALQTFWYRRLLLKDSSMLLALEAEAAKSEVKVNTSENAWTKLQSLLTQLRKVCQHPYLLPGSEIEFDGMTTGEDIVEASGKLKVLDRLLTKLADRGHRVVLFSQWNRVLDILEDYLIMRGTEYYRLDGSTNRVQRAVDMRMFNQPNSTVNLYILNTRAGGLGVNLQTADTCIIYDSDWNPQWDLQAMARVHRIGQTKPVHAYRLCSAGTVEERVLLRAEKKLYLDQMVNRGSVAGGSGELGTMDTREVLSMLRFGAERIFTSAAGQPPSDAQLDAIISRTSDLGDTGAGASAVQANVIDAGTCAAAACPQLDGLTTRMMTAAEYDATQPPLSTFILNGEDYTSARSLKAIHQELSEGRKRESKQRLINIDGFDVLRDNAYTLEEGEPSIFEREGRKYKEPAAKKEKKVIPYEHSDTCQVCWDGGELLMCDSCPCACHADCLGVNLRTMKQAWRWFCTHHECATCGLSTSAAGGLLFRCQACEKAYCEDCLPHDAELLRICKRFEALGQPVCKQACYINCSAPCQEYVAENPSVFNPES